MTDSHIADWFGVSEHFFKCAVFQEWWGRDIRVWLPASVTNSQAYG